MQTATEKFSNGNSVTYKIVNGTAYHIDTPQDVITILDRVMQQRQRIRVFYGDRVTGRDWLEECDIQGYIGRSIGDIKIPLMVNNSRSFGGPALLDHCIVKITINKKTVYQHSKYHTGELSTMQASEDLRAKGYYFSVYREGENIANFKKLPQAVKYVSFLRGERNK